ncbi:hypothetical protein [Cloacibacillus sp. An23]|uniref:hypothetical protein n=1 Tax=Cloacibacillus sp. An23 TaxID=1965591 RepID=UPI000B37A5D9|nr:hypothetical protein [Cloacibacillus sp. An23]OUO94790.1 hypothetical protein B5F39_02665 [Cloacibacillus sp. An23]
MGRKKKLLILQTKVIKIMDIISLMLDCHPVGYLVLCGREEWPSDEDIAEMLRLRNGSSEPVHVQGGPEIPEAQRRVEAIEGARRYMSALDRYGGTHALISAVNDYRRHDPQRCELLKRIGMAGMPGAKSLEALAGEYCMDMKTLYANRREAVKDIAMMVVYGGEDFELAG